MAEKFLLSNGMRLLLEYMPHVHSVSTGVWVNTGSAREDISEWGVSHLLEHMLFKGTKNRSSIEISSVMDNVGGVLNAFTSKEYTCYYTHCLDEYFELSLDLLSDMYSNSLLDAQELDREKQVVIEEINMYEDSPDEQTMELFAKTLWPNHSYGRSISGTVESVAALTRDHLTGYMQRHYTADNTVLAVAGNVTPKQAVELAEKYFGTTAACEQSLLTTADAAGGEAYFYKDIEQTHLCIGFPGLALTDSDYYTGSVLNCLFGGSASARLFQEIREKRGLSYSAFSYMDCYRHNGYWSAYASTQPDRSAELAQVMVNEFARLLRQGVDAAEIEKCKQQLKGSLLLQLESTNAVMGKLGKTELSLGRLYSADDTAAGIMRVTHQDVIRVIEKLVQPNRMVMAQVGPKSCGFSMDELWANVQL